MAKVLIGNFKGPKGDKGDKGDPGTAATIQVGTTQTVQPEENAEVTNSGTANAAILNFKIPRGADGMTDLTAEYKDASEYTCQPTVNAPVVVKELDGKTEQGENPSPDNPQAIKGVGGMGYFDGEWKQGVYQAANGTWQAAGNGNCSQNPINAKAGDNVTLKYPDEAALVILAYKNDGTYLGNNAVQNANEVSYTLPTDTAYVHIDVQMAQGTSITPSTAKYCTVTINGEYQTGVEVTGAQLFDANEFKTYSFNNATVTNNRDGSFTISGSGSLSGAYLMIKIYSHDETLKMIKSGTLNLSCGFQTCPYVEVYLSTSNGNKNYLKNSTDGFSSTEIENETLNDETCKLVVQFYGQAGDTIIPGTIRPMLYQFGDGTYQPYHHTTLTIPLTAPLYEGDKICYVKPGESYVNAEGDTVVADGILYGVYRENAEVVFDGSEDENIGKNAGGENIFSCTITNKVGSSNGGEQYLKCNKLTTSSTNSSVSDMPDNSIKESGTMGSNVVFFNISEAGTTVESLRAWLSNNPLTVVYRLAQPYFEPFIDQSIFYDLRTDDTLSYVYSSDPIEPNVTVEVAKNSTGGYLLESYAQAQKNAISEANSQSRIGTLEQQLISLNTSVSSLGGGCE